MFTDIAGYTTLTQTDESAALRLLQEQDRLVRPLLEIHRGRLVKSMGDGLLIEFANALDAVECAEDLQRHIRGRNAREGAPELRVRIGIHLGDVQGAGKDILGDAVNIASRLEPIAEPGGICLSEAVYGQVRNKVRFQLEKLGQKTLKGVREPMDVYRVVLPEEAPEATRREPSIPRIAILPLTNISPDPQDEYFADGLTEELISVLSQIHGLRVIARTSVTQYKGTSKPVGQIGVELDVTTVLEGSVRKAGNRLRITLQLIDVGSQEHIWAETYNRELNDVFAIQAEVAEQTAGALKLKLLQSERDAIREKPTSSLEAYELYLRGVQASRRFDEAMEINIGPSDLEAERYLEAAIREDPGFSAAYAALATHLISAMGSTRLQKEVLPKARALVDRALELNPASSDAHLARANLNWQGGLDWPRAEAEFQQAISLNQSSSSARRWYGYFLESMQRLNEARKQLLAAIELDPLWVAPREGYHMTFLMRGEFAQAISLAEDLVKRFNGAPWTRRILARDLAIAGRFDEVRQFLDPKTEGQDLSERTFRASVLAYGGNLTELRALMDDVEAGRVAGIRPPGWAAANYARLGDKEKTLTLLEQEYQAGESILWNDYQVFAFDVVRDDPRFVALLKALHLPLTLPRPRWSPPPSPQL